MKKRILLVDTNSIASRAFYVGDKLFFTMMGKGIADCNATHTIFCFDGRGNWRNEVYPEYKANRLAKDDGEAKAKDLKLAFLRRLWAALKGAGFPVVGLPEFEADDIIATLVEHYTDNVDKIFVMSGDKDLLALANQTTVLWFGQNFYERAFYDRQGTYELLSLYPEQLPYYKALAGESTDNIPGVPQIGPVRAKALLRGGEDAIYTDSRVQANLPLFETSLTLAKLRKDAPVGDVTLTVGDIGKAYKNYLEIGT